MNHFAVAIVLLFAMVGVVSLVIISIDFILTIAKNIKKEEDSMDERIFDP